MLCCRLYAFDVHCNSFFPLFLLLYGTVVCLHGHSALHRMTATNVSLHRLCAAGRHPKKAAVDLAVLQFLLSPVLLWRSFLSAALSNALYIFALGVYNYLNFMGYSALPFLERTEVRRSVLLRSFEELTLCSSRPDSQPCDGLLPSQVFLWPIGGMLLLLPFSVLSGFNPTIFTLSLFFR